MVILMESLEVPIIEEKNLADPVGETLGERGQIPFVRTEADTARAATVEMVPIPLAQCVPALSTTLQAGGGDNAAGKIANNS
jgi:hypothetical protein